MAVTPFALSIASAVTAAASAFVSWRARQLSRRSQRIVEELSRKYADAIGLVVFVARATPPIAHPDVIAACEKLIAAHHITATVTTEPAGSVH